VSALTAAVLLVAGCGGAGTDAPSESAAKAAPSATAESSSRDVTASVDGRKLSGHCSGTQRDGTPVILLESGAGGDQYQLEDIERRFAGRTLVCGYDRAGVGESDPPAQTPRPVSQLVADLDAFAAAADARPPYLLVGQSMGANVVLMYAQEHPEKAAGFVSMNPVPPAEAWINAVKKVMTKHDFAAERAYYRGAGGAYNPEHTSFLEPTLNRSLPSTMPYAVMYDNDCDPGTDDFCRRILAPELRTTRSLAAVGDGGRFVRAKGAGHEIFTSDPQLVHKTINDVLNDTR
jgi:pimeloyl-ACP methyl ester carboxylesterase